VQLLNDAIMSAGGPEALISCIGEPTIDSAQALMKHKSVRLIVVTGGPAVVRARELRQARDRRRARQPARGRRRDRPHRQGRPRHRDGRLDGQQHHLHRREEVFAVSEIADRLKKQMLEQGCVEVVGPAINRLEKLVVEDGHPSRDWVGKDAAKIAEAAGIRAPAGTRLLLAEVDATHPFVQVELLMPVLPLVRLPTVEDCIAAALQAEHGFGHTATMQLDLARQPPRDGAGDQHLDLVKNGPSLAASGFSARATPRSPSPRRPVKG